MTTTTQTKLDLVKGYQYSKIKNLDSSIDALLTYYKSKK